MIEAFNYIAEQIESLLEARLPDFVERYFKYHQNNPMYDLNQVVRERPFDARQAIAVAHPHATNHEEAIFMTTHLLNGMFDPNDEQGDVNELSKLVKFWRKAKTKKLISPEANMNDYHPDELAKKISEIPGLDAPYIQPGSTRKALRNLKPYKLGEIDHPTHGKLSVYHFNIDNLDPAHPNNVAAVHENFKKLCSGEHYGICIMSQNMFQNYATKKHGLFTFMDKNGKVVYAHGSGDHPSEDSPGGNIVNPRNETLTPSMQQHLKKQISELLPEHRKFEYKQDMGVIDENEAKNWISATHLAHVNENRPSKSMTIHRKFIPYMPEHVMDEIYHGLKDDIAKIDTKANWEQRNNQEQYLRLMNQHSGNKLHEHILNKLLAEPKFHEDKLAQHIYNYFLGSTTPEQLEKIVDKGTYAHKQLLIANGHKILPDEVYHKLLNDPNPKIRHNLLISFHTNAKNINDFIENREKYSHLSDEDIYKSFLGHSSQYRDNLSALKYVHPNDEHTSQRLEPGFLYYHHHKEPWKENESGKWVNPQGSEVYGYEYDAYKKENENNKRLLDNLTKNTNILKPLINRDLELKEESYGTKRTFGPTAVSYLLKQFSDHVDPDTGAQIISHHPEKHEITEMLLRHPHILPQDFIEHGLNNPNPKVRETSLRNVKALKKIDPAHIDELMDVSKSSPMDDLIKKRLIESNVATVDQVIQHLSHKNPEIRKIALAKLSSPIKMLDFSYAKEHYSNPTERHNSTLFPGLIRHHNRSIQNLNDLAGHITNPRHIYELYNKLNKDNEQSRWYASGYVHHIREHPNDELPNYKNIFLIPDTVSADHFPAIVHPDTLIEHARNSAGSSEDAFHEIGQYVEKNMPHYENFLHVNDPNHIDHEKGKETHAVLKNILDSRYSTAKQERLFKPELFAHEAQEGKAAFLPSYSYHRELEESFKHKKYISEKLKHNINNYFKHL